MIGASFGCERRPFNAALAVGLVVYAIVVSLGAVTRSDQINSDGIAYIRTAVQIVEGHWLDSVTGYWSPLLPWSLAPLLYFGCDGLHASRVVLAIWGAVLVVAAWVFLGRCTTVASPWNGVVLVLIGTATAQWTTIVISPDVLLGALLLWYFAFTARPDILSSRRAQILAGAIGGAAYLAKSYAFPFVIAHYSLTTLLHFALGRSHAGVRGALKAWATGLIAFAIVAGPWIGVLSSKYGRLTFSTVVAANHNLVGPPGLLKWGNILQRAHPIPLGRITVWETPELLAVEDWSPFASWDLFKHQLKVVKKNCDAIIGAITDFDRLSLVPGFLFLMLAIRLAASRQGTIETINRYPAMWLLMTIIVFAGGFLPMYFEPRYIYPVLWPLCCIAVFDVLMDLRRLLGHRKPASAILLAMSVLCTLSFATVFTSIASDAMKPIAKTFSRTAHPARSPYRECGDALASLNCEGPVAACDGCWATGLYVSYHASLPFMGVIHGTSPAAVETALEQNGARIFVATPAWALFNDFQQHTAWRKVCTIASDDEEISMFVAPERDPSPMEPRRP